MLRDDALAGSTNLARDGGAYGAGRVVEIGCDVRDVETGDVSPRRMRQTVYHDAEHPSHGVLPVIPSG